VTNKASGKPSSTGQLIIAGCGLHPGHMTLETKHHIQQAEIVMLVCPNPLSIQHIMSLNSNTINLGLHYQEGTTRLETYRLMAKQMVDAVKSGQKVCAVFYGHPGIFVLSTHLAYRKLASEGFEVKMLPGISADACLYADLNIDPATTGNQCYEATQLLLTKRSLDPCADLIIWQIGLAGEHTLKKQQPGAKGLEAMVRMLSEYYPGNHQVCLYQAPTLPGFEPIKNWITLNDLPHQDVPPVTTLYIPASKPLSFAAERLDWLGLSSDDLCEWDDSVEQFEFI
jgi:uroporphyrin-III C-methyltransferase